MEEEKYISAEDAQPDQDDPVAPEAAEQSQKRMPTTFRWLLALGGLLIVLVGAYLGWRYFFGPSDSDEPAPAKPVVRVQTAKAEFKPISRDFTAVGTITSARQAVVSANSAGQVTGLGILRNAFVRQGQLLATIDTRDLRAREKEAEAMLNEATLNAESLKSSSIPQASIQADKDLRDARASVDNARNLFQRRKDLYEKGGISLKDLEASQLALTQAEANLKFVERSRDLRTDTSNTLDLRSAEARIAQAERRIKTLQAQISLAEVRAPISGIVIDQTLFDGEYANPGQNILTIADTTEVIVKAGFPDTVLSGIKQGDPVTVQPKDLPGENMVGKVSLISRSTDPSNRTSEIWVRLANGSGRLRIGGAADVVISGDLKADALVVPASAVVLDAPDSNAGIVMVVDKQMVAHERKVTVGIKSGDIMQIVSGLKAGETVVTDGNYALPDGTKVVVKGQGGKTGGVKK